MAKVKVFVRATNADLDAYVYARAMTLVVTGCNPKD